MKKIIVTILILLYSTTSIGATIHLRYCMGELISWKLNTKEKDDKCSKCDMKCKKGCCEDKTQVVKIDNDQKIAKVSFDFKKFNTPVGPPIYQKWKASILSFTVIDFLKATAPPCKSKVPLFVRNGAFLI